MDILSRTWRLNNLYYIVDKSGEKVRFKKNNIQRMIDADTSQRKAILKARQFGVSTNELINLLDGTIFRRNVTSCILAHEQDSIKKLFRIVRRAYEFLPDKLKPELDRGGGSKYEMYFPAINSRIYADLESRGDTIHNLHVSECAFMKDSSRLKSTIQAVPIETGRVTIETTPNGIGNFFYDLWIDNEQPYKKLFYPWYLFEDYRMRPREGLIPTEEEISFIEKAKRLFNVDIDQEQLAFRRYKQAELRVASSDKRRVTFEQEYPEDDQTCFLSSGDSVIDTLTVKRIIESAKDPIETSDWLKVYNLVDRNSLYVIGADTAEGYAGDFSVAVVIEVKTLSVVAKIRGHWRPHEFAHRIKALAERYRVKLGFPLVAVERNNHGHAVLLELEEHVGYSNLYKHSDDRLGWRTDLVSRPLMMNAFIHAVESNQLKLADREILSECLTLVNTNGKIQAADTKHDDCIVATAIALQMAIKSSTLETYSNIGARILT